MKSEKELFHLAVIYTNLQLELEKDLSEFEKEEIKDELEMMRNTILQNGCDINKFVYYQELYMKMSIEDYFEFTKTLEN